MKVLRMIGIVAISAALGFAAARWLAPNHESGGGADSGEQEILYWVAPMDPNYRRDEPGKSPMGMDLVPVYADGGTGDGGATPGLRIDPAVVNNIGVRTEAVVRTTLNRRIDTLGFVTPDAERIGHIHVRSEGWIENLVADHVGERVEAGDVVFEIYSPALVSAQDEYLQALRVGREELVAAAEQRLRALGMLEKQIQSVRESRRTRQRFEVRSPQDGYIMELNVRDGMYVEPGMTIMSLADLSAVWIEVDVFEQQIGWVEVGQSAEMRLPFDPERVWHGTVDYVYPTIRPETRTARVRLAFDNPDLTLKPNMYAAIEIAVSPRRDVLTVPDQAVIRTGSLERVVLAQGNGRFRPAEVITGIESEGRVEIVDGLAEGERIVVSGQFLIDSEASMDASLLRMLDEDPGAMEHDHHGMHHMDHSGHDMHGMDHSGHDMEEMDHSGHDMGGMDHSGHEHHRGNQDAPTPTLPREQGREKHAADHSGQEGHRMDHSDHGMSGMDHSGHGMDEMDHSGHDMGGMDHSGHEHHRGNQDAPTPTLPREQGREEHARDHSAHEGHGNHESHERHEGHKNHGSEDSLPPPRAGEGRGGGEPSGSAERMSSNRHDHASRTESDRKGGSR